jgi:polyadenylate-binding protein
MEGNTDNTQVQAAPAETTQAPPSSIPILLPAASSLYVGDLAQDVTEADLFNFFSVAGDVALVRVCRDASRRKSLGYAYVNFLTSQDAEKALKELNNAPIKGRPCRVMWSQRDSSIRKSGVGNLYIKNLAKSIDLKTLNDLFSAHGTILSSKIALDHNNKSRGHAFVNFSTQEEADKAIAALNGTVLADKELYVGKFIPKSERQFPDTPKEVPVNTASPATNASPPPVAIFQKPVESFTNIFIKNLDESVTEETLKEIFSVYGDIESALVSRNPPTAEGVQGKSKGFGFVNFHQHEHATVALKELNGKVITEGGKPLLLSVYLKKADRAIAAPKVQHHQNHGQYYRPHQGGHRQHNGQHQRRYHGNQPHAPHHHQGHRQHRQNNQQNQGINLYVKGFDASVTEDVLKAAFVPFGNVLNSKVMKDAQGASKKFGFITVATTEEAQKAIAELNGKTIGNSIVHVDVAKPREQHNNRRGNFNNKQFRQGKRHFHNNNNRRHNNGNARPQQQQQQLFAGPPPSVEEQVYFKIHSYDADLAGQITGMIIEEYKNSRNNLAELLMDEKKLRTKFEQAKAVFLSATQNAQAAQTTQTDPTTQADPATVEPAATPVENGSA